MQPFPTPSDATHKIDQDWPTGYRDIQVQKCEIFGHSKVCNSKMSGLIRPKIKLDQAFMPVPVTSNFDDDSIKNERASMETQFSHNKSGKVFRRSKAANSVVRGPIWPKLEIV